MAKHEKADPEGYPIGEPPGKRDGSPQRPGKHTKPDAPGKPDKK